MNDSGEGLTARDVEELRTAIHAGRGRSEEEIRADERRRVAAEREAAGLVVTGVCACGQPLGSCPCCGGSRCWRCDPGDTTSAAAEALRARARAIGESAGEAGDPLAEAVWDRCGRDNVLPATLDDPRTIAQVAYQVCADLLAAEHEENCCG